MNWHRTKSSSKIISNKTESVIYTVSANKAGMETHVAARHYYYCTERKIEKTTTRFAIETISKITVKYINFLMADFQYLHTTTFIERYEPVVTAKLMFTNIKLV